MGHVNRHERQIGCPPTGRRGVQFDDRRKELLGKVESLSSGKAVPVPSLIHALRLWPYRLRRVGLFRFRSPLVRSEASNSSFVKQ